MAYTTHDEFGYCTPIRLIGYQMDGTPKVHEPLPLGTEWINDACAPSRRRYAVTMNNGHVAEYAWWQVVQSDDTEDDIRVKLEHAVRLREARLKADAAHREWEKLNGI